MALRTPYTPIQVRAAHLLAMNYTQESVALQLGVSMRTIARWHADHGFYNYIIELGSSHIERIEEKFLANVALSLDVIGRGISGEIDVESKQYAEARRFWESFAQKWANRVADSNLPAPPVQQAIAGPSGGFSYPSDPRRPESEPHPVHHADEGQLQPGAASLAFG